MSIKDWWSRVTSDNATNINLQVAALRAESEVIIPYYDTNPERRYKYQKDYLLLKLGKFLGERKECTKYDLEIALEEFAHAARAMENMSGVEKSAAKSIVENQYYLAHDKIMALVFCTKDMSAEAVEAFIKGLENKDE